MEETQQNYTIMFADVAGSTRIYDTLGDSKASELINYTLELMSAITARHGGVVIKTIGDEVMCRFPTVDNAVETAIEIHETLDNDHSHGDVKLAVRIGLHCGPALLQDDGDLLGDAVNVAARMAGVAKARQIITTEDTVQRLNEMLSAMCREFDRATVKGKAEQIIIYEVVWEQEDVTRMSTVSRAIPPADTVPPITITYKDQVRTMHSTSSPMMIGRGSQCNLVVDSTLASRTHVVIEFNRGKYILIDQSTNGTYVSSNDGKYIYLRRENLPLWGSGTICLGEEISPDKEHLIHYEI